MEPASHRSHTPKGQLSRARILRAAEPLLAARGFHGTSMRDVADAAEVPLASVVYHFTRKENLYAALLADIAGQLLATLGRPEPSRSETALDAATRALVRWSLRHPGRVRLILRELLDNPARVSQARSLPLAPVLTTLAAAVARGGHLHPEIAVLHVFGAISYVVAARPTLRRIVGTERERELMATYEEEAVALARRAFATGLELPPLPLTLTPTREPRHGSTTSDRARSARPRSPRGEDD